MSQSGISFNGSTVHDNAEIIIIQRPGGFAFCCHRRAAALTQEHTDLSGGGATAASSTIVSETITALGCDLGVF